MMDGVPNISPLPFRSRSNAFLSTFSHTSNINVDPAANDQPLITNNNMLFQVGEAGVEEQTSTSRGFSETSPLMTNNN